VTSYERRGRADGPAFDRGNFTTAAPEKQHLPAPRGARAAIAPPIARLAPF
jgi:hypothetical protein